MALTEPRRPTQTIRSHSLIIEIGPRAETCLVRLRGELDSASADALTEQLLELLATDLQTVVLDLEELEFIDSSGLRALLVATRRSRGDRDQLRIISPTGHVARVFKLTNLETVLPLLEE